MREESEINVCRVNYEDAISMSKEELEGLLLLKMVVDESEED